MPRKSAFARLKGAVLMKTLPNKVHIMGFIFMGSAGSVLG